ncbi:S-layer homology domain-containing protein [Candidatus Peregrinibacteria bacterium]|nr:S-layer homology domain-containing protein [Candidatus Peregrinibacteria bacterium]
MKVLKKILKSLDVIALGLLIVGLSVLSPVANAFSDVPYNAYYADALDWAISEGVVDSRAMFYPAIPVKKVGMAKMTVEAMNVGLDSSLGPSFIDVPSNQWYYPYVETGAAYGVFTGYTDYNGNLTGYFGPVNNPTRAEAITTIMRAFGLGLEDEQCSVVFPDVDYSAWYAPYIETACRYEIVQGDPFGRMRPADAISRAEFITMLYRAATYVETIEEEPVPIIDDPITDPDTGPDPIDVQSGEGGTLIIQVAPNTALPTVIPGDAAAVDYVTFALTALGDDVKFNGATLHRSGLGSRNDFAEVWFSIDNFMVGSTRTVNSDGYANLMLGSDYIVVPEGETVLLNVKASMSSTVGANLQNRLGFRGESDFDTDAYQIQGTFPMYGNHMTTSSYTVGNIEFSNDGSASHVDVGDMQTMIGEFKLENESTNNEDFVLGTIDLEINGSGNFRDIENAAIYYLGEKITNTVTPMDDHLRFVFLDDGYVLEDGDTVDFAIKADIVSGDDDDTIRLQLDDDSDFTVFVANSSRSFAVDVDRISPTTGTLSTYTINAGNTTFARHSSSPSATEIPPESNAVTFLVAQLTMGGDVIVEEMRVYIDASLRTGSDGETAITSAECADATSLTNILEDKIDNVKIWNSAKLGAGGESSVSSISAGAYSSPTCTVQNAYYLFSDNFVLNSGLNLLTITADVSRYTSADETYSLSFDNVPSAWLAAEYYHSGEDINTADVNGSATGSVFTIESGNIVLARQDGYSDGEDLVVGMTDALLLTFKIEGNDAGDITVTDIDIQDGAIDIEGTLLTGIGIYDHGTDNSVVRNILNLGSDDIAQFDGLDITIPSGGFRLFDVRGSISTSWDTDDDLQLFVTGIQAKDESQNDATITYPNCRITACSPNDAIATANFSVNSTAEMTFAFDSRNDSDYSGLIAPTGGCYGSACAQVAELEIHPLFDSVILKKLILTNDDDSENYSSQFGTFYLYDEDSGDVIDTGSMSDSGGDGTVSFDGFGYTLSKDDYHNIGVYVQIHPIERSSQTGAVLKLYIDDSSNDVELVSESLGQNIASGSITNNSLLSDNRIQTYVTRRTVPTISYNNSDQIVLSTMSNHPVYEFTITADDNGDLEWEHITFKATENGSISSSNYKLYVKSQSTSLNSTGVGIVGDEVVITPGDRQQISKGLSTTYVLKADIDISGNAPATLGLTLTSEGDTSLTTTDAASLSGSDFAWSDKSDMSHSLTTPDWTNGYQVEAFDVSTVNVGFPGN